MTSLKIQIAERCSTLVQILLMKTLSHVIGSENTGRTIVKFLRRKDCDQVMRVKSKLKKLKPSDLNLPGGTKLYINESLCPYYRGLWNHCKKLWNRRKLFSFFTINGSVRLKLQENGSYNIITHIDDLKEIFPDEDFTMFLLSLLFFSLRHILERRTFEDPL